MSDSPIIKPFDEQKKKAALAIGHSLVTPDQLLRVKVSEHQIQVTIGWETPQDALLPLTTLLLTPTFARELAEALSSAVADSEKKRSAA